MSDPYGYQAAKDANDALARQREAYRSTTEPLAKINDTLKEIYEVIREVKVLLIEIRNVSQDTRDLQNGKSR